MIDESLSVPSARLHFLLLSLVLATLGSACSGGEPEPERVPPKQGADEFGFTPASAHTRALHAAAAAELPLDDKADFEAATRGRLASDRALEIATASGDAVWSLEPYAFIDGAAPDSVNPSLWRQARLNNIHGLFEVTKGVYQVRGYDLANMTLIEGRTGWIVVDPLTANETAAAAFALVQRVLGAKPVSAVIFTHSHIDHFGGIAGVLTAEEALARDIPIIAPGGFMSEATSENVLAGIAMSRRSNFMFGLSLPRSERGHVDSGLGKGPAFGTISILPPTLIVDRTPTELVIDGIPFVFQFTPESEAPAELTFYLPEQKLVCGAEVVSHTMHNLYTLRGAKVRNALLWAGYIDEMLELFGDAEILIASHHWPTWGNDAITRYLQNQRDTYKFMHDQTLRLANAGATPREIAEVLSLPQSLAASLPNRGYYGTLRHNIKAVYQWYFGWYDANPANLDPLPPQEEAVKYVEFMGGAENVLSKAKVSIERGEYRWAATVLNHVVFADSANAAARGLLADAYDQLGYQAESGPWRDVYLTAAYELRNGKPNKGRGIASAGGLLLHTPMQRFLESLAARIDANEAAGKTMTLNFVFTDIDESWVLHLENSVLHHRRRSPDPNANVTVRVSKQLLLGLVTGTRGIRDVVFGDELDIDGSRVDLISFFTLLQGPDDAFAIVTP